MAYGWNLNSQTALPVLLECQARGIEFHVAGVLYFGGYGNLFDPAKAPAELQTKLAQWATLGQTHGGFSVHELAIAFSQLPYGAKTVLGMATAGEVDQNVAICQKAADVPRALWKEAQAAGLLAPEIPL